MIRPTLVVRRARQVLTMPANAGPARSTPADVGCVEGPAAVAVDGDRVAWTGPEAELDRACDLTGRVTEVDATGCVVLPGLCDPHTHLVFGGARAAEFHRRNAGATYLDIAREGGGIAATMRATRAATDEELIAAATARLRRFLAQGVTLVEVKSGYGLDARTERRLLEVIRALHAAQPVDLVATFLGAHVVPPELRERAEGRAEYLDLVCGEMIPDVARAGLAEFCDVFCEEGAFSPDESRRVLEAGLRHGLRPRIHAEQFSAGGGARLAAALSAASCDHLEAVDEGAIEALAAAGTVAVLLPGVSLFLGSTRFAPARKLLDAGVRVALGTDCNPGTCHTENLWLMATLGCTYGHMTAEEALAAVTVEASRSLLRHAERGHLLPGARADVVLVEAPDYRSIPYHMGMNDVRTVVQAGRVVATGALP